MAETLRVNRCLKDKAMDHIDHALGRPLDPLGPTYRRYFVVGGALADAMAASPWWDEIPSTDSLRGFVVTLAGRAALAAHLREINDPNRAFIVSFDGHRRTVVSTTRAKARYSYFLDLRDVWPDLRFEDFCRSVSVAALARPSPDAPKDAGPSP